MVLAILTKLMGLWVQYSQYSQISVHHPVPSRKHLTGNNLILEHDSGPKHTAVKAYMNIKTHNWAKSAYPESQGPLFKQRIEQKVANTFKTLLKKSFECSSRSPENYMKTMYKYYKKAYLTEFRQCWRIRVTKLNADIEVI